MVAHELAAGNLGLGASVVVDAVNPVPQARAGWQALAEVARLVLLETVVPDVREHRRRVTARMPDLAGQNVPTWADVTSAVYEPWDERRDGPRTVVDTTDVDRAVAQVLERLG